MFQVLAILLTYCIVISGFDLWYFTVAQVFVLRSVLLPAMFLGGLVPIFLPLLCIVIGLIKKNTRYLNTASALIQSAFLGLVISSTYKLFTGRIPPMHGLIANAVDASQQFQFGFMRGGVFWGWPSSHTTIAFATMVTLIMLYPKNVTLKYAALAYAFYVGFGVSMRIHWFSEFVAGAIIGSIIGVVVGRAFYERMTHTESSPP
jgi:membrane-associated phospholipid phosphatase